MCWELEYGSMDSSTREKNSTGMQSKEITGFFSLSHVVFDESGPHVRPVGRGMTFFLLFWQSYS